VKTLLRDIPENNFQDSFRQWHHRLMKRVASQGEYFEGNSSRQYTGNPILFHRAIPGIKTAAPRNFIPW
jgi:hypothetical protein